MFLFFLSLIELNPRRLVLPNNKVIGSRSATLLSEMEDGWYYVNFPNLREFETLSNTKVDPSEIIDFNWISRYLTKGEAKKYSKIKGVSIFTVNPSEKSRGSLNKMLESGEHTYIVKANAAFNPQGISKIQQVGNSLYVLKTNNNDIIENDNNVYSYTYVPQLQLFNRWTTGFLQTGSDKFVNEDGFIMSNRALTKKGLNGSGVIVTLIDSGVDDSNCFFHDSKVPLPIGKTDLSHRKIVRYNAYVDNGTDYYNGHGTHCAGIIAGSAPCENCAINMYQGHAPAAKLFVVDIGKDAEDETFVDIFAAMDAFNYVRELNSTIISCSWGLNQQLPEFTALFDMLTEQYPESLMVIAAGNTYKHFDINSPADSKNVLTVGATTPPWSFSLELDAFQSVTISLNNDEVVYVESNNIFDDASYDPIRFYENLDVILYESTNLTTYDEKVVVVLADVLETIKNLESSSNAYAIIVKEEVQYNTTFFPIIVAAEEDIVKILQNQPISIHLTSNGKYRPVENADFSSKGPTLDQGLMKPDISVPGYYIASAKNSPVAGECNVNDSVIFRSGTSMATPAVSGIAAIIMQYLNNRMHGLPYDDETMHTDSIITKAFIIHASQNGTRLVNTNDGYGVPNISSVLPLEDEFGLRFGRHVIGSEDHHVYKVRFAEASDEPLKVTMVSRDPALEDSSFLYLFADLDLFIVDPKGDVTYGNQFPNGVEESFSSVEKITIPNVSAGEYEVHVYSNKFPVDHDINYTLVITGGFPHKDFYLNPSVLTFEMNNKCAKDCNGNGDCVAGKCQCIPTYSGDHCQTKVEEIMIGTDYLKEFKPREYINVKFDMPHDLPKILSIQIKIESGYGMTRVFINTDNEWKLSYPRFLSGKTDKNIENIQFSPKDMNIKSGQTLYLTLMMDRKTESRAIINVYGVDESGVDVPGIFFSFALIVGIVVLIFALVTALVIMIICFIRKRRNGGGTLGQEPVIPPVNEDMDLQVPLVRDSPVM